MDPRHIAHARHRLGQTALQHLHLSTRQYHDLWIVERRPEVQNATTGLFGPAIDPDTDEPYDPADATTQVTFARVVLGGREVAGPGGLAMRVGDAVATHVRADLWPMARLLAAAGFRVDGVDGELYELVPTDGVLEAGHNTFVLTLARQSQPRPS